MSDTRCSAAIQFGVTLTTRCMHAPHSPMQRHEGRGLEQFPYQRIEWLNGDRRTFESDRSDKFAWDEERRPDGE